MKSLFLSLILIIFISGKISATLIIDSRGIIYSNVITQLSNIKEGDIEAVIVSHPFTRYDGWLGNDNMIYDFYDTGDRYQMGGFTPTFGNLDDLLYLIDTLHKKNILVYSDVDVFRHRNDYNLNFWKADNFYPKSLLYSQTLYLDIQNNETKSVLLSLFHAMKQIPVDKWVFDMEKISYNLTSQYIEVIKNNFRQDRYLILSDSLTNLNNIISSIDYWNFRENMFMMPLPNFNLITDLNKDIIHFIDSDSLSINNLSTVLFFILNEMDIVVNLKIILNDQFRFMIDALKESGGYKRFIVNKELMILYSDKLVIGFNLSDDLSFSKTPKLINKEGFYKSINGSGLIRVDEESNYFVMLPRSVYIWKIN